MRITLSNIRWCINKINLESLLMPKKFKDWKMNKRWLRRTKHIWQFSDHSLNKIMIVLKKWKKNLSKRENNETKIKMKLRRICIYIKIQINKTINFCTSTCKIQAEVEAVLCWGFSMNMGSLLIKISKNPKNITNKVLP